MNGSLNPKAFILDELEYSINILGSREDPHYKVHEIRKSFKKIRSYLRLIKGSVDFKRENRYFRDLGMQISDIRDLSSCLEAMESLKETHHKKLSDHTSSRVNSYLRRSRNKLSKSIFTQDETLIQIKKKLTYKRKAINKWEINYTSEEINDNFNSSVKAMVGASAIAKTSNDTEDYHEWRKKVKHLRYQLDILSNHLLPLNTAVNQALHQLSNYLGWDHDLAILEDVLRRNKRLFQDKSQREQFIDLLHTKRTELKKAAVQVNNQEFKNIGKVLLVS